MCVLFIKKKQKKSTMGAKVVKKTLKKKEGVEEGDAPFFTLYLFLHMSSIKIMQDLHYYLFNAGKTLEDVFRCASILMTLVLSWLATRYLNKTTKVVSVSVSELEKLTGLVSSIQESSQKTNQAVTDFIEHQFLLTTARTDPDTGYHKQHPGKTFYCGPPPPLVKKKRVPHLFNLIAIKNFKEAERFLNFAYRTYHAERRMDESQYELWEEYKVGDLWMEVARYGDFLQLMEVSDFHEYCKMKRCDFTVGHEFMDVHGNVVRKLWVAKESEIHAFLSRMNQ
ncbi:uncharacterized protein EV154DRAFT_529665 [Mucor mucedo]|uniref:uncharacterized protein n=1 Tax=Mucor mucedo TaxID=29922 RepID=UPI00221FC19D|nr:uncharacterized protein EV154DRAFT_529665 [Mucor mucedo]KAI7871379.1 hypothetical protein EV154DRAFT_529665 [Mucor mucedo]